MDMPITWLLKAALWAYVAGALAGLLCLRREKQANLFAFGAAAVLFLAGGKVVVNPGETLANAAITRGLLPRGGSRGGFFDDFAPPLGHALPRCRVSALQRNIYVMFRR